MKSSAKYGRRIISNIFSIITISTFFLNSSGSCFLLTTPHLLIALTVVKCIYDLNLFPKAFTNKKISLNNSPFLKNIQKIILKPICFFDEKIKLSDTHKIFRVYNNSVVPALVEESLFRGVFQEIILRQLPKLALRSITSIPPEVIDLPIFQNIRILTTGLLFAFAHIDEKRNMGNIFDISLSGIKLSYLSEKVCFSAAILSHYNKNLYVSLANC